MLFHPREPKKFLFITFQGIFPKRQQQFAEKLGQLVSKELISFEDIKSKLNNPAMIDKAMPHINADNRLVSTSAAVTGNKLIV